MNDNDDNKLKKTNLNIEYLITSYNYTNFFMI